MEHLGEKTGECSRNNGILAYRRYDLGAFGRRLRYLRRKRKHTQKSLGEFCGVNESAIRNYERGLSFPRQKHLEAMAQALDVVPETLVVYDFTGDGVMRSALEQLAGYYGLSLEVVDQRAVLKPLSPFMAQGFDDWWVAYTASEVGALEDLYNCYTPSYNPEDFQGRYRGGELEPEWVTHRFAAKLKSYRRLRGLTQSELAIRTGIELVVIGSYEQARRLPKRDTIRHIAEVLYLEEGDLTVFDFGTPVQAIHVLFQLERQGYGRLINTGKRVVLVIDL